MNDDVTIECPFCASTLKAHATVCPNCQAVRGAGADTHGNVRGSGYVAFIRVLLGGWAMVIVISLTIGIFRNEGGAACSVNGPWDYLAALVPQKSRTYFQQRERRPLVS